MTAACRLAAILAADVVGYSRLMGEDEAGTARGVRECPDMNVLDGTVIGCNMRHHRHHHQEFILFLNVIEKQVPAG